ncbi:MAG TPA: HAMP domain-containing sensor histidine kinase [Ktedonobacterales bacterium]|nr:HAMP domain-containing sensor histidine kinase [Ktedonobacterales bacterium]
MSDVTFAVPAERQIYAEYDRDRRLRISRVIAPIFAGILLFILLMSLFLPHQLKGTRSHIVVVLLCCVCFAAGAVASWYKRVNIGTATIIAGALLLMILSVLVNQPFILSDLFTVPAVVIIGLSALIGLPWMIFVTAACTSAFVLVLSGSPSLGHAMADPNNVNSVGAFIVEQWLLAAMVYATARGYRRILHRISDVSRQYERARQLDELKDQFITNVNHELRNPVMLMQGYIELLRLKDAELQPERRTALIQRASQAGDSLVELLKNILDVRRLDQRSQDFAPEPVPVFATLADAASLVDPREGRQIERELRVSVPQGLLIWGDRVRLQQILTNLLSNAIKYSANGTPVEVAARLVTSTLAESKSESNRWRRAPGERRAMVELTVRDHGLGIPPDQAPLLFERFVRLPRDLASTTVGNGLGLYICRELTEAMGGVIWVESSGVAGEGSTFHVNLPQAPHSYAEAARPSGGLVVPASAPAAALDGANP